MHELGIVEQLVRIAVDELEKAGAEGPVSSVSLRVGVMSGASPEALRTAWEVVVPNTRLKGAELLIDEPPATCRCLECGATSEVDGYAFACPSCNSGQIAIEGGSELQLASLEVEES